MKTIIFYAVLAMVIIKFDVLGLVVEKIGVAQGGIEQIHDHYQRFN